MGTLVSNLRVKTNNNCTNLCICIMHVSKLKAHLHKQKNIFRCLTNPCVYVPNVYQGSYMQRCLESIQVSGIHCTKYFFPFFFFNKCSTELVYDILLLMFHRQNFNAIWQKPLWISTVGGQAYMAFNHILLCT